MAVGEDVVEGDIEVDIGVSVIVAEGMAVGAGGGGGVNTGTVPMFPVTTANLPHTQQVRLERFGS